jgi:hypothetical protein
VLIVRKRKRGHGLVAATVHLDPHDRAKLLDSDTYLSGRIPTDSGFFQAPDSGLRPSATPESGFG